MNKLLLIGLLTLSSHVIAQDCFELAGRDYKIDPDLLRAISWHESRNRVNAIGNSVQKMGSNMESGRRLQCWFSQHRGTGAAQENLCRKNTEHLSKYKKQARAMKYVMPRQQHGRPVDEIEA